LKYDKLAINRHYWSVVRIGLWIMEQYILNTTQFFSQNNESMIM